MNEIKCPKCGTVFQISESDYESILKQIRDKEFEKEIKQDVTDIKENQTEVSPQKENIEQKPETNKNSISFSYFFLKL